MRGDFVQRAPGHAQGKRGMVGSHETGTAQPELRPAPARVSGDEVEGQFFGHEMVIEHEVAAAGALETHNLPVVNELHIFDGGSHHHVLRARRVVADNTEPSQEP